MKGDSPAAPASFRRTLALSLQSPAALKAEAQLLYQTGDKRATPVLEQIVKIDPADQTAQEMLGRMQAKADNCSSATEDFAQRGRHPLSFRLFGAIGTA